MKKICLSLTAICLSFLFLISALPFIASAEVSEKKSPFSNITCVYDKQTSKVKLEYRMKSEDVKKYAGCEIELYALSASQGIDSIPKLTPKVTGLSPSNRAGAEVRCTGLYDRLCRYVFALNTADGELICSEPILPQVRSSSPELQFKGIETGSTALSVSTAAGTIIIDIDCDSLISNGIGYLYRTSDYTYTFSSTYLDKIDDLVMLYRGAGRRIVFRLTSDIPGSGQYEEQRAAYACVSFLISRYDAEKYGGINGFVIGSAEQNKADKAEEYANILYAVAAGLDDIGVDCPLIVPVCDDLSETAGFLDTLVGSIGESPMFTVMLESKHSPYGVNDEYVFEFNENDDAVNSMLRPADQSSSYVSSENLTRLTRLIDTRYRKSVYQDIIYNWVLGADVTGEAAVAGYVYNYYALSQLGRTESFVISPGDRMNDEFIEAVKFINTRKSDEAIDNDRILSLFDLDSWGEHFKRLDIKKLETFSIKNVPIHYGTLPRFIGTVDYFDFSSSADISGWYAGRNCSSVYSDSSAVGKSLNAKLTFPEDRVLGSAFVSYTYRYSESFKYTDYMAVELSVESSDADAEYDIIIAIGGDGFLYEYSAESIPAGSRRTLYLDVREFDESNVTDFLRITVEPRAGEHESAQLCLYSVTANSMRYNSATLKAYILSERERLKSDDAKAPDEGIYRNAIVFLVAIIVGTVLVMITISKRRKRRLLEYELKE